MGTSISPGFESTLTNNVKSVLLTAACALLILGFLYYFYTPPGTKIGPEQPIPFSHRLHAGIKEIQCQFCHPYVGRSIPEFRRWKNVCIATNTLFPNTHKYWRNTGILIPIRLLRGSRQIIWPSMSCLITSAILKRRRPVKNATALLRRWTEF